MRRRHGCPHGKRPDAPDTAGILQKIQTHQKELYLKEPYLKEPYLKEPYLMELYLKELYLMEPYLKEPYLMEAYLIPHAQPLPSKLPQPER